MTSRSVWRQPPMSADHGALLLFAHESTYICEGHHQHLSHPHATLLLHAAVSLKACNSYRSEGRPIVEHTTRTYAHTKHRCKPVILWNRRPCNTNSGSNRPMYGRSREQTIDTTGRPAQVHHAFHMEDMGLPAVGDTRPPAPPIQGRVRTHTHNHTSTRKSHIDR